MPQSLIMYFIVAICIIMILAYRYLRSSNLDFRGPPAWPIIGNMCDIDLPKLHMTLFTWAKQYGDVFKLNLFGQEALVVSKIDTLTELMVSRSGEFNGRPNIYEFKTVVHRDHEAIILAQPSKEWKIKRKLVHTSLRMFDTGLERIEQVSMTAISSMLEEFAASNGSACDPKDILYFMTMNIFASFLVGKTFKRDSEYHKRFENLEKVVMMLFKKRMHGAVMDALPFLHYFTTIIENEKKVAKEAVNNLTDLIQREAKVSEEAGFHDSLVTMLIRSAENGNILSTDIQYIIIDLVLAGSLTTTTSMYGFVNIMIHERNVQEKLHKEIQEVIGERKVTLKDRDSLPYAMATLQELLRYTSVVPNGVFHMTTRDTTINGKHVPANTPIYFNHFSVNHDESNFPDSFIFRPERFLDENGRLVAADHPTRRNMNAFGAGLRGCLGESLAKARLFLAIVAMIQRFKIEEDDTRPLVTCDPRLFEYNMVLCNNPYAARFVDRRSE